MVKKYEYGELIINGFDTITKTHSEFFRFSPDGEHMKRKGLHMDIMAEIGAEGWRLVGVSHRREIKLVEPERIVYVFIREKEN